VPEPRVLSYGVKEKVVQAAVMLLTRAGCEVSEVRDGSHVTLDIHIPADSADPHGDALVNALKARAA
jgi:hypothetical protein